MAGGYVREPGVKVSGVIAGCKKAFKEKAFNGIIVNIGGTEGAVAFQFRNDHGREVRVGRELRNIKVFIHWFLVYGCVE